MSEKYKDLYLKIEEARHTIIGILKDETYREVIKNSSPDVTIPDCLTALDELYSQIPVDIPVQWKVQNITKPKPKY